MTGPRRRPPHPVHGGLTIVPPKDWTPAPVPPVAPSSSSRPSSSTVRRRPRDVDARSRQRVDPLPGADLFAQIPAEVLFDRGLDPIDAIVWGWFAMQREMWNGARGPLKLKHAAAVVGRDEKTIRASVARLEARGHIIVTRKNGTRSTYSVPWLNIHKLGRRMSVVGE